MKAISLHQPWASLIAHGNMRSETRLQCAPLSCIGETLAIHAAKTTVGNDALPERLLPAPSSELPRGVIVCTAKLLWCGRITRHHYQAFEMHNGLTWVMDPFGNYEIGRWVWALDSIKPLRTPVPVPGRRSIWSLDAETTAAVISEGGAA